MHRNSYHLLLLHFRNTAVALSSRVVELPAMLLPTLLTAFNNVGRFLLLLLPVPPPA